MARLRVCHLVAPDRVFVAPEAEVTTIPSTRIITSTSSLLLPIILTSSKGAQPSLFHWERTLQVKVKPLTRVIYGRHQLRRKIGLGEERSYVLIFSSLERGLTSVGRVVSVWRDVVEGGDTFVLIQTSILPLCDSYIHIMLAPALIISSSSPLTTTASTINTNTLRYHSEGSVGDGVLSDSLTQSAGVILIHSALHSTHWFIEIQLQLQSRTRYALCGPSY